jgi:glutathione S-transferase
MDKPLLWHLPISHYSEKARWALDWKRIPHRRRVMPPGLHPLGGLLLTRGQQFTMPVLTMDGRHIGDSTAIIGVLEERYPAAPLYPAEPDDRRRALELEDFFDEELGPYARRWAFHELLADPDGLKEFAVKQLEWAPGVPAERFGAFVGNFVKLRYSTEGDEEAAHARDKVAAALERLEAELDGREFLVGDRFTVADLTAAALFYPIALPPGCPWAPATRTEGFLRFRDSVRDRPGFLWVEETFRRFRRPARAGAETASV